MNTGPQKVRWGPSDGKAAGITVWRDGVPDAAQQFVPWSELVSELNHKLLPQLFADPTGFNFQTVDYHGKKDWLVRVLDAAGAEFCAVWFGGNPDEGWEFDGLVHLGDPKQQPHVWQSYQRNADGTYHRVHARCTTLDEVKRRP